MNKKQCQTCKSEKRFDLFYKNTSAKDGYSSRCKECCAKYMKDWQRNKRSPIRWVWGGMIQRCQNPNNPAYEDYGKRGIKVCGRWKLFKNFENDMIATYKEGLTLERVDNNGDYCPENCKWVSWEVQANNRRNARFFECNGKKQTLKQWSHELGIKKSTLSMRIYVYKWPLERVLTYNI